MPFLDREHFTPHFFSEKRQGTVTGAVATLLGTLLGKSRVSSGSGDFLEAAIVTLNQHRRQFASSVRVDETARSDRDEL